jgi:hypothetical protein
MSDILKESDIAGLFESVVEVSKATPHKISVDFDRRFHIWTTEILPGRMLEIKREGTTEYIYRMMDLLFSNGDTLTNRAIREGHKGNIKMLDRIRKIDNVLETELTLYLTEIDRLKLEQLNTEE